MTADANTLPDGTTVRQSALQFICGVVNAVADSGGSFSIDDIRRALESPYRVEKKKMGKKQVSIHYIGSNCSVRVNPNTGKLLSVNYTQTAKHR